VPHTSRWIALLSAIATLLAGCAGPESYNRRYFADELICSIDESVRAEVDRKLPSGYLTQDYSPNLWIEYWNRRISTLVAANLHADHRGYVGPSGRALTLYALSQRRGAGLPDLAALPETRVTVESLYAELSTNSGSSCAYLANRNPECSLSPAQYPGDSGSRRLTRHCS
jgi:hypothetical protein